MIGPLPLVGGKNRLAKKIIALIPEHRTYVEPFAGGAQVFFHKEPSAVEVLNDIDFDIVNFFRVCQGHYEELVRQLQYLVVSRRWYDLMKVTLPETLTDIQRAARFFYLQKNSFGGLVRRRDFHYGVTQPSNCNPRRFAEIIEKTHRRLQRVQIECLPYEQILKRYDRTSTFFYLDPPYWGRKLYRKNLLEEDFVKLEQRLRKIKGKFVLSLNDHPKAKKLLSRFEIRSVEHSYTAQRKTGERYQELLITNYHPPPSL
jgi:DNA adenine methylase